MLSLCAFVLLPLSQAGEADNLSTENKPAEKTSKKNGDTQPEQLGAYLGVSYDSMGYDGDGVIPGTGDWKSRSFNQISNKDCCSCSTTSCKVTLVNGDFVTTSDAHTSSARDIAQMFDGVTDGGWGNAWHDKCTSAASASFEYTFSEGPKAVSSITAWQSPAGHSTGEVDVRYLKGTTWTEMTYTTGHAFLATSEGTSLEISFESITTSKIKITVFPHADSASKLCIGLAELSIHEDTSMSSHAPSLRHLYRWFPGYATWFNAHADWAQEGVCMVMLREDMLRYWMPGGELTSSTQISTRATDCGIATAVGYPLISPTCPRIKSFDNDIQSLLGVDAATHEITLCYKEDHKTTDVRLFNSYNQLDSSVAAQARCSGILNLGTHLTELGGCTSEEMAWMASWSKTSSTKSITACSKPKGNVVADRSCQKSMTQDTTVSATHCLGIGGAVTCPNAEFLNTLMTTNAVIAQSLNGDGLL